jgi:hypothetical protein
VHQNSISKDFKESPSKKQRGDTLDKQGKQIERWTGHSLKVFKRPANTQPEAEIQLEIHDAYEGRGDERINIEEPTKAEIRQALKEQKNGKAPGIDSIPPEVLKQDLDVTVEVLHPLLVKIWKTGVVPDDWKKGLLVKLPKKGDVTNCKN